MSTQQPPQSWDGETDFRALIDALARNKWVILVTVAVGVVAAGILSYVVLPPTYKSTVVVSLPAAGGGGGLGMNPQAYAEFAASPPVMAAAVQQRGSEQASSRLVGRYTVDLDEGDWLLTVVASAQTGEDAWSLANGWKDAFYQETLALLEAQLARQKAAGEQAVVNLLAGVSKAEEVLDAFDQETPISLMEDRLSIMQTELVDSESRYREVTLSSIPTDRATLAFLKIALSKEQPTLSGSFGTIAAPESNPGAGVTSSEVTILNPVYLQLSQELVVTEARLATSDGEAKTLVDRIPSLQDEVDQLREMIITAKGERNQLSRIVSEIQTLYDPARLELTGLLETERQLPELSRPGVVSEPGLPQSPVTPRKVLNITFAAILAALLGVFIAFLREWYGKGREQVALADSPSES